MYKIGLSTAGKIISEDLFKNCKESGIELIELSTRPEEYMRIDYGQLLCWSREYGVKLWSMHLPFYPFEKIDFSNPEISKKSIEDSVELIKKGADIGIDKYIVHPSAEPIPEEFRSERLLCARESLSELAEKVKPLGAVIAVEDLPRTCLGNCSDEIQYILDGNPRLMACLDTNHLLKESVEDFILKIGNRIITTHISDCDLSDERHWLPGEGKLNWKNIYDNLSQMGYTGGWIYELGFASPKSMPRSRALNCRDFANNANEIFFNKNITLIK